MDKVIHFSIDDIGKSLRYLTRERPDSLFDLRLFGLLRQWHEAYGIVVTLYCYAMVDQFLISEIPDYYAKEFRDNADWLKLGFHGKCDLSFAKETGYVAGFTLCRQTFERLGSGTTETLRLHSWLATAEQKRFLASNGITTLLYPNDNTLPYGVDDTFMENGLLHRRTHVWFEHMSDVTPETLFIGKNYIAIFTHEWCFDENAGKIQHSLAIYKENGYTF